MSQELTFSLDKKKLHGIIKGAFFDEIREHFSVSNDAAKFSRYKNRFAPSRKYVITPTGKFDLGLYFEIKNYIYKNQLPARVTMSDEFKSMLYPSIRVSKRQDLNLKLRDYQTEIVTMCLKIGRGVTVLATAGGKTLTMASLLQNIWSTNNTFKCLLIVPNISLVTQTYNDFREYGVSFLHSKWSGDNKINMSSNVIIANTSILQSSKSDISWLAHIDTLVIDEVHGLRKSNKINSVLKGIKTQNRFGFTGTLPEDNIDQWNIIGKIGPIIYEKNSHQLRSDNYISNAMIQVLKLKYKDEPKSGKKGNPLDRFSKEMDFLVESKFRNSTISKLCMNTDNNCLILLDYIKHGDILYRVIKEQCKDKKVFFIQGDVEVSQRETIRNLMEERSDIICIAISKIFSTGINIKNLHYIMFAGSGKAKIKTLQSIGRGLRKHDSKDRLIIFDIADQLHYGRKHMLKRLSLYSKEKIQYGIKSLEEK